VRTVLIVTLVALALAWPYLRITCTYAMHRELRASAASSSSLRMRRTRRCFLCSELRRSGCGREGLGPDIRLSQTGE